MSGVEFQLVKIQTCILKVHIHCEGCAKKVKKVLKGIEGVYGVDINLEEQKVMVCGMVDSEKLIRKLSKSKKHAELWSPPPPPPIHTESPPTIEEALNNNWITNGKYDLINGGHESINMDPSSGGGEEEYYMNDVAEIEYLMNNNNMRRRRRRDSSMENKDYYYYPPSDNNNNNIRSSIIGFQDLASNNGETEFEDKEFPRHLGLPTYPPGMIMKMNRTPEEHVGHHQSAELINSPMSNFRVIPNTMQSPELINSPMPNFRVIPDTTVYGDGYRHQKPQIFMW